MSRGDRIRVELAAFRRLRLALIAEGVPHACADDLARQRVEDARSVWRDLRDTPNEWLGKPQSRQSEARAVCEALYTVNPRFAVPSILASLKSRRLGAC